MTIQNLPNEIQYSIYSHLGFSDISRLKLVCQELSTFFDSIDNRTNSIYRHLFNKEGGLNYEEAYNPITSAFSLPTPFKYGDYKNHSFRLFAGIGWKIISSTNEFTTFIHPQNGEVSYTRNKPQHIFDHVYGVQKKSITNLKQTEIDFFDIKTVIKIGSIIHLLSNKLLTPDVKFSTLYPFVEATRNPNIMNVNFRM